MHAVATTSLKDQLSLDVYMVRAAGEPGTTNRCPSAKVRMQATIELDRVENHRDSASSVYTVRTPFHRPR